MRSPVTLSLLHSKIIFIYSHDSSEGSKQKSRTLSDRAASSHKRQRGHKGTKTLKKSKAPVSQLKLQAINMCGCTLYDSPTCGHSWISMSQPCGFLSDLLNCPYRQTYQTLIAPPYSCPTCHRGFADRETIEMVQGPWGCNQLIRSHVGGNHAIPGQWGHVPMMGGWGGASGLAGGMGMPMNGGAMVPVNGHRYDHRLIGPYPPPPPMMYDRPMICDGYDNFDDGFMYDMDFGHGRKRKHRSSKYEYRWSSKPDTSCTVM